MASKAKLLVVLAFVVMLLFVVGNDADPVEVTLENSPVE